MNAHKVEGLVNEVVAQRLEQTLHQGHAQAVNSWPAGGVLGLSGEALLKEDKEEEEDSFQLNNAQKMLLCKATASSLVPVMHSKTPRRR